eukprot:tig00020614_g12226.t1
MSSAGARTSFPRAGFAAAAPPAPAAPCDVLQPRRLKNAACGPPGGVARPEAASERPPDAGASCRREHGGPPPLAARWRSPVTFSSPCFETVASLGSIRSRIASLHSTRKLTEAVRVVALAKVHRAQQTVQLRRPFAREILRLLFRLTRRLEFEGLDSPLLCENPAIQRVLLVVIGADRGLCGNYNSLLVKQFVQRASALDENEVEYDVIVIGSKAESFVMRRDYHVVTSYSQHEFAHPSMQVLNELSLLVLEAYANGFNRVEVCYSRFINAVACKPVIQTLLPLRLEDLQTLADQEMLQDVGQTANDVITHGRGMFDKDLQEEDLLEYLDSLVALYVRAQLLRMICESSARGDHDGDCNVRCCSCHLQQFRDEHEH